MRSSKYFAGAGWFVGTIAACFSFGQSNEWITRGLATAIMFFIVSDRLRRGAEKSEEVQP